LSDTHLIYLSIIIRMINGIWRVVVLMIVTLELEQRMTMVVGGECK